MGGLDVSLFTTPIEQLWKERRSSFLTSSTCGSFLSGGSPQDHADADLFSNASTRRSSEIFLRKRTRTRTRTRSIQSLRSSMPIFEESRDNGDNQNRHDQHNQPNDQPDDSAASIVTANMFASATIRVWKQTALPNWMNVFVPRYIRLRAGPQPYMEYARQEHGPARQRAHLSTATRLERLSKNKLEIDFDGMDSALKWVLRFENKVDRDVWAKKIQDAIDLLGWIDKFSLGQTIMDTDGSTLVECYSWLDQEQPSYVMKAIQTESKPRSMNARNEIRLHHMLTNFSSHPNILALHDSFRQQERAYLVLEYCAGGDLFEHLRQHGSMDEVTAKVLFRRVAEAVAYMHDQNVVHLDIKPENLMFKTSPMHVESIKLADFGSAQLLDDKNRLRPTLSCTIGYAAPEVLDQGLISYAADVFSLGAVLYTMLGGYAPFHSASEEEAMTKTVCGDFSLEDEEWEHVSAQAKDLICGMLEVDPKARMSMEEVLDHAWLQ